jgi:hypothetical protein
LRSRERLRACGWRRVDNGDGETMFRCGTKTVRQPSLSQKLDMGKLVFSAICPYDGALLGVQVEERRLKSAGLHGYREVHGHGGFADTTLLGDKRNFLHFCTPSVVHTFTFEVVMDSLIRQRGLKEGNDRLSQDIE